MAAARGERSKDGSARPQVLYVLGAHRSGSTILGVTLGNCEGVFFAGELHAWQYLEGTSSVPGDGCEELWERVREGVPDGAALFGAETQLLVDRTSSLLRPRRLRRLRELRGPYRRVAGQLYQSIAAETGASHIVDTSHYALRARELQQVEEIDLHLIFLVRDPHEIVESRGPEGTRLEPRSPLRMNFELWATYLLCLRVFLRHPRERRMFVRHEDFVADPDSVVRQILDRTGSSASLPDTNALEVGCPLQGNRFLKGRGTIALRPPGPRRARRRRVTTLMQLPFRAIFRGLGQAIVPRREPISRRTIMDSPGGPPREAAAFITRNSPPS